MAVSLATLADPTYARIRLTVSGSVGSEAYISRLNSENVYVPVRNAYPIIPISGTAEVYDYEAPLNTPVTYQVYDGSTTFTASPVTLTVTTAWLKSPHFPTQNVLIKLVEHPALERKREQGVHRVLGRKYPIVVSGMLGAKEGTMRLLTGNQLAGDALSAFVDLTDVVLLLIPDSRLSEMYFAVGDISETPLTRLQSEDSIYWSLGITEVESPVGDFVGNPTATYNSLKDGTIPTYTNLKTVKATYLDVMRGAGVPTTPPNPGAF